MRIQHIVLLSVVFLLTACSSMFKSADSDSTAQSDAALAPFAIDLISTDFVNALRQLPAVSPDGTTVALLQSSYQDVFVQAMHRALKKQGYGIRWVEDGESQYLLQYRKDTEAKNKLTVRDVYEVAFGYIEMRRTYLTDAGNKVRPATPLYVRGIDASGIVLNDDIFDVVASKPVVQGDALQPIPDKTLATRIPAEQQPSSSDSAPQSSITLQNDQTLPRDANPLRGLVADASGGAPLGLPLVALPRIENVFELGGSNYEDILAGHKIVVEQILTFPNDSLRLGTVNKKLIDQLVSRYNPQSDVFSVIGCSLGPTRVSGGNAALALGRASRVVEALLFSGVAQDSILDEGCWAGHSEEKTLPRRGVVLSLNRKL